MKRFVQEISTMSKSSGDVKTMSVDVDLSIAPLLETESCGTSSSYYSSMSQTSGNMKTMFVNVDLSIPSPLLKTESSGTSSDPIDIQFGEVVFGDYEGWTRTDSLSCDLEKSPFLKAIDDSTTISSNLCSSMSQTSGNVKTMSVNVDLSIPPLLKTESSGSSSQVESNDLTTKRGDEALNNLSLALENKVSVINVPVTNAFEGLSLDEQLAPECLVTLQEKVKKTPASPISKRPKRKVHATNKSLSPKSCVASKKRRNVRIASSDDEETDNLHCERYRVVASGTMHQSDSTLKAAGGVQCVFLAATAAALSVAKNRSQLNTQDIDTVLKDGTKTYLNYLSQINSRPRLMDPETDVPTQLQGGNFVMTIEKPVWVTNGLYTNNCSYQELKGILDSQVFIEKDSLTSYIFTFRSNTTSFWQTNNKFYLFNSHAIDENGVMNLLNYEENKARLFCIDDLNTLAKLLLAGAVDGHSDEYSIHRMTVISNSTLLISSTSVIEFNQDVPETAKKQHGKLESKRQYHKKKNIVVVDSPIVADEMQSVSTTLSNKAVIQKTNKGGRPKKQIFSKRNGKSSTPTSKTTRNSIISEHEEIPTNDESLLSPPPVTEPIENRMECIAIADEIQLTSSSVSNKMVTQRANKGGRPKKSNYSKRNGKPSAPTSKTTRSSIISEHEQITTNDESILPPPPVTEPIENRMECIAVADEIQSTSSSISNKMVTQRANNVGRPKKPIYSKRKHRKPSTPTFETRRSSIIPEHEEAATDDMLSNSISRLSLPPAPDTESFEDRIECVARGEYHQGEILGGQNLQCVILATICAAYSVVKERGVFTGDEINTILKDGTNIYLNVVNGIPNVLSPSSVPLQLDICNYAINISSPEWKHNGLYPFERANDVNEINDLETSLKEIFTENDFDAMHDSFLFTFQQYTVSFWCARENYHLFNSHAVDRDGKYNSSIEEVNKARLFRVKDAEALAYLLLINAAYGREDNQYAIHKVKVMNYSLDPECIIVDTNDTQSISLTRTSSITTVDSFNTADNKKRKRRYKTVFGKKKRKTDRQTKYKKEHPEVQAVAVDKYIQGHPEIKAKKNINYKNVQKEQIMIKTREYNTTIRNLPHNVRNIGLLGELSGDMLNEIELYSLKNVSLLLDTALKCQHCGARLFQEEQNKTFCCGNGQYNVVTLPPLAEKFYEYPEFLKRSRAYNNAFAFSSIGTSGHADQLPGPGFIKIQGRTYHRIFDLSYTATANPLRYYVYDEAERFEDNKDHGIERDVVMEMNHYLHQVNPFIDHFKRLSLEVSDRAYLILQRGSRTRDGANLGSNVTSNTEIAALISCDEENITPRSVVVWKIGTSQPHTIDLFCEMYEPLHYVLLYPHGTLGWYLNKLDNKGKKLTQLRYYRYLMLSDYRFSELGRLSEEWLVDMFSRLQEERLNYLKKVQNKWRTAPLNELVEAAHVQEIVNDETIIGEFGENLPGRIFLPNTFTGGPRYMQTKYMDGIALVNRLGRPSYFITFTCNPNWPEITQSCRSKNSKSPVIVARVFKLKLQQFLNDLRHGQFFGRSMYIMHIIEFQKRGLPHAHICLRVDGGGPVQNADIDKFIRADIPSPEEANGRLRKLVLKHMIHGPCGIGRRVDIPCWNKDTEKCERYFPKPAAETTHTDSRGFVIYKRNAENSATIKHYSKEFRVDDQWVVPYNAALLLKYDAHINIEIAATRKIIKYIFKYMTKGPDKARVAVVPYNDNAERVAEEVAQPEQTTDDNNTTNPAQRGIDIVDETEEYITHRFLGSCEATWRLLSYEICEREPAIIQLPVHLEGKQNVIFKVDKDISTKNATSKQIIYFKRPLNAEFDKLTYEAFYEQYIVHGSKPKTKGEMFEITDGKHYVTRRQRGEMVARIYWITPNRGELFYLRMLLQVYPCRCYGDLLALGGPDCTTFQQAARHVGLADDEQEYERALLEASTFCTGRKLRNFFVLIISSGAPALLLWEKFKDALSEDYVERDSDHERAHRKALIAIDRSLRRHGSCARDQGLPEVFDDTSELGREHELYNSEQHKLCEYVEEWFPKFSVEQMEVFDHIRLLLHNDKYLEPGAKTAIFIDGPSGTGKSLLLNVIAAHVRGTLQGVALCAASSGVAAMTLEGGTTIHSMFKMPLELSDDNSSVWNLTNTSQRAEMIKAASIIIIDEAPMSHKYLFHILDRSLRDLMQCSQKPFGGKIVILAGDFRQIPPVVKSATCNADIVRASLRTSYLWPLLHKFKLSQAQRTKTDDDYSNFLLNLGSGLTETLAFVDDDMKNKLQLISLQDIDTCIFLKELIDFVFPSDILNDPDECAKRAILTTHNINVRNINTILIEQVPGEAILLFSVDTVEAEVAQEFHLGPDTLNMVQCNGVPDHTLVLKIGCVCLITRNLSFADRLVNGTKVIVVKVTPRIVTVRKPDGDETFLIPRIIFKLPVHPGSPVEMSRLAFPLQLCYAMTVHKSQGQTISRVGVDLRSDVFSHGQLYVALGRVRSRDNIKILISLKRVLNGIPYANNVIIRQLIE